MKNCSNCGKEIGAFVQPWHKCLSCGKEYCGLCGDRVVDKNQRCKDCRAGGRLQVRSLLQ